MVTERHLSILAFFGHSADSAANAIHKPPSDWKWPPVRPNHTWLRAIESDLRPLNIGPSYTWNKAASREHWRSLSQCLCHSNDCDVMTRMRPITSCRHTHMFNGPLSGTTRVSRYQKGKTNLDFTGARDSEWQWHQLGMCKSAPRFRQITTPAPHHSVFYRPDALPAAQPTASKHWRHKLQTVER